MERKTNLLSNLKKGILFAFCAVAALLVSSCEIGLGAAVDTLPPEISITNPKPNAVIRNEFVLSGECSDDVKLDHVTVQLENTRSLTIFPRLLTKK